MSDMAVSFIIWVLAVFGSANIIVNSSLFKPVREVLKNVPLIGKLIVCILCMGFWTGVFFGLTVWNPADVLFFREWRWHNIVFDCLFNGCVGSGVSWLIYLGIRNRMLGV